MRQVPHYLIIGNGRLARHLCHYFSHIYPHNYRQWHRAMPLASLPRETERATHILLAISDKAIDDFIGEHLQDTTAIKIHFSGSLVTPHASGAHPLMTFGPDLYPIETYRSIPFIVDDGAPDFADLLPGLTNPHMRIKPAQKAKYHALCVMAGNFSCILWQKLFSSLEEEFGIPAEAADMFLRQQTENLLSNRNGALTGPLARGDKETLRRNLDALTGDPFESIYEAFVAAWPRMQAEQQDPPQQRKAMSQ